MRLYLALTVASLKMYFRNRQALFWAMFFPLLIMGIFGLLNFDRFQPPAVGVADMAGTDASGALVAGLRAAPDGQPVLNLREGSRNDLMRQLQRGSLAVVAVIPEGFGNPGHGAEIELIYDVRRPQERMVVATMLNEILRGVFNELADVPADYRVESHFQVVEAPVAGQGQGYRGFLVPGVAAMAIMQAGIFGVVFSLVRFRAEGVLRRLMATPISPAHFLVGQIATRLTISVLQTFVLLLIGAIVLGVTIGGNDPVAWLLIAMFALLGGALFISIGLAISGAARTEDTAAPVANIIALPMMFLSGVFFPPQALPAWLHSVAQFLPLTYLANGIRGIATEGAGLAEVTGDLAGLGVWLAVSFVLANRMFRWE